MTLTLTRLSSTEDGTLGELAINGERRFFTMEPDEDRPQHPAIPVGTYPVVVSYSTRFKRMLPVVLNVPGRLGIRIHPGNTEQDTEGCILLGMAQTKTAVLRSREACELFQSAIAPCQAKDEPVLLYIIDATSQEAANGSFPA